MNKYFPFPIKSGAKTFCCKPSQRNITPEILYSPLGSAGGKPFVTSFQQCPLGKRKLNVKGKSRFLCYCWLKFYKLDKEGPIDNKPSTN